MANCYQEYGVIVFNHFPLLRIDSEGKIALTEWFKKVFGKKPEYAGYFDEDGKIKWNILEKGHMLLEIKASKDGDEITRMFAFTEREQEIIGVRVREIAGKDDFVECVLRLAKADDYLQGKYMVSESVAQQVVERVYKVMQYETREELAAALEAEDLGIRNDLIGAWGEWKGFQIICERKEIFGEIIRCQVKYPKEDPITIMDFVTDKYIVEVKNWDWSIQDNLQRSDNLNGLIDQMGKYKMAQDSEYNDKRVMIFFYREIPKDVIGDESKGLMNELLKIFQDRSRFEIVNGVEEIPKLGS